MPSRPWKASNQDGFRVLGLGFRIQDLGFRVSMCTYQGGTYNAQLFGVFLGGRIPKMFWGFKVPPRYLSMPL